MSDIFAMQRANGDWFALDHHGRLRVPLFHSSQDAMIARLRNSELLVFKPVLLDAHFLKAVVPLQGENEVDFCIVNDPFTRLNRGSIVGRTQLALLIPPDEHDDIGTNGNSFHVSDPNVLPQSGSQATETWEDEGGRTQSVREGARKSEQVRSG